jgi:hypothetical protein
MLQEAEEEEDSFLKIHQQQQQQQITSLNFLSERILKLITN